MNRHTIRLSILSCALFGASAISFANDGALVDGNGGVVSSSYTPCVLVSSGASLDNCGKAEAKTTAKAASEAKADQLAEKTASIPEPKAASAETSTANTQTETVAAGFSSYYAGSQAAGVNQAEEKSAAEAFEDFSLSGDALFDTDSDQLSSSGRAALGELVSKLNNAKNARIDSVSVIGHADNQGDDSYNQNLSERRAKVVGNYLISQGVEASLIKTSGRGEADPVASNDTSEGRAKNRRVGVSLYGVQQGAAQ